MDRFIPISLLAGGCTVMQRPSIGDKFHETRDMDIKEVATLIRADLKKKFPLNKFSVRIQRYSMGQSINIETPVNGLVRNEEYKLLPHYAQFKKDIEDIVEAYNYDDSDLMTDYFNVRFYTHINLIEGK